MPNTINYIGRELSNAFAELSTYFGTVDGFNNMMLELGWQPPLTIPPDLTALMTDVTNLVNDINNIESDPENVSNYVTAVSDLQTLISGINGLSSASFSGYSYLTSDSFASIFPQQLLDFLLCRYVQDNFETIYSLCLLMGVIKKTPQAAIGSRPAYIQEQIIWTNAIKIISNPQQLFHDTYGWGTTNLDATGLIDNIKSFLFTISVPSNIANLSVPYQQMFMAPFPTTDTPYHQYLEVPIYNTYVGTNQFLFGLGLYPIMHTTGTGALPGFAVFPYLSGGLATEFLVADSLYFGVDTNVSITSGILLTVLPNATTFTENFNTSPTATSGSFVKLYLENRAEDGSNIILFGDKDGSNLSYKTLKVEFGAELLSSGNDIYVEISIKKGDVFLDLSESDGFISKLVSDGQIDFNFEITFGYSTVRGVYFKGSAGLEVDIPLHFSLGPVNIDGLDIVATIQGGTLPISVGTSISAQLGPVFVEVDKIGLTSTLSFPGSGGNLGPLDATFGFKPPMGVGISIDADAVTGGGYLYFDQPNGRYYGAAQLKILDKINISAVGIITTKMPDGSSGYSFLLLVNVTFEPSIPIGFGFSLNGVGGLVGINRDMNPQPLRDGVKNGTINEIMFPDNVVSNIDHLIHDLESYFPAKQDRYTFGLFFLIDWGMEVPVVTMKLGLLINLPNPVRLAILGNIEVALPDPDDPLLELNIAFVGIIDFTNKYMTFDASIYNSHLLSFSLSGDMAVRLFWGDHKEMVLSVGGFHPAYSPPSYLMLPANMNRLTISIFDTSDLKLKFSTYFALTSNTLQFGACIDFLLHVWKLNVVGYFGFDVLFQLNPFHFTASIKAGLAVKWGSRELLSISMDITLDGPGLWHAKGSARFKVLFVKKTANLDKTWGNSTNTTLPSVTIKPLILASLGDEKNWQAELPADKTLLTNIRPLALSTPTIVLHPLGILSVGQNVVPLGSTIERFGSQKPTDGGTYDISDLKIAGTSQTGLGDIQANFAPAQFRNMSDDQKLKAASFEFLKSGTSAAATDDWTADLFVTRTVKYNTIVIDQVVRWPTWGSIKQFSFLESRMVNDFAKGGMVSANSLSVKANARVSKPIYNVSVKQEEYKLVSVDSLSPSVGMAVTAPLSLVIDAAESAGPLSTAYTSASY